MPCVGRLRPSLTVWTGETAPQLITESATIDANGALGVRTRGSLDASHVYADDDDSPYTVTITVTDDDGGFGQATLQVTVNNVAPTITAIAADQAITEGLPLTITNVISFSDPGFNSETFTYSIDLGDGSTPITGSVVNPTNGAFGTPTVGTFDATLTYGNDDAGTPFTTTVTLFDDNGGNVSGTFRVSVANFDPIVELVGPSAAPESSVIAYTYNFTVTDTGIGETYSIAGSYPDCGTGGTPTGTPTINPSNGIGSFQCIFPDGPSTPFVRISVSDGTANSNVAEIQVTVANLPPVVGDDPTTTDEDTSVQIYVLANDSDVPSDTVEIGATGAVTSGTVSVAGDKLSLTYDPFGALEFLAVGDRAEITFTYNAVDDDGDSSTATVTVTVTGVNDQVSATNTTQSKNYAEDIPSVALDAITVTDADSGEIVTATLVLANPATGVLTSTAGSSTYTAGNGQWQAVGTTSEVSAMLAALEFRPALNNDVDTTVSVAYPRRTRGWHQRGNGYNYAHRDQCQRRARGYYRGAVDRLRRVGPRPGRAGRYHRCGRRGGYHQSDHAGEQRRPHGNDGRRSACRPGQRQRDGQRRNHRDAQRHHRCAEQRQRVALPQRGGRARGANADRHRPRSRQ